jgi:hypothetical protein
MAPQAPNQCGTCSCSAWSRWLGDAAMILRDPPALHLLAAEFVELLYRCVGPALPCGVLSEQLCRLSALDEVAPA